MDNNINTSLTNNLLRAGARYSMDHLSGRVSVNELKLLFLELKEHRSDICVRIRFLGRMWCEQFTRIIKVTENGVLLNNEEAGQVIMVTDLLNIIQFEIDGGFRNFQPHFHYQVEPSVL